MDSHVHIAMMNESADWETASHHLHLESIHIVSIGDYDRLDLMTHLYQMLAFKASKLNVRANVLRQRLHPTLL